MADRRTEFDRIVAKYFQEGTGARETMLAIFGSFETVRNATRNAMDDRDRLGVSELLFSLTVGLPMANPFWQRSAPVLHPLIVAAQLDMQTAADYADDEKKLDPNSERSALLRRKIACCLDGLARIAVMAMVLDKGLDYARKNARALRDDIDTINGWIG